MERVYVEAPVYETFVALLERKVGALRQSAPGGGPGSVEVGAITFAPQLDIIDAHVADALERGARALTGGHRAPGPGQFYEPTLLVDVDHSMLCMTEETFGPLLPVMRVSDADEAVEFANDCHYGLQASVWTRDRATGERLARQIRAGACCVNDAQLNYAAFGAPMSGWKASGVGSRHGAGGIRKYCRTQTLMVNRFRFAATCTRSRTRAVRRGSCAAPSD